MATCENGTFERASATLEAMRGRAPKNQEAGIALALTMLARARATATPDRIREYRGERGFALAQIASNAEAGSPDLEIARAIITRLIA